MLFRSVVRHSLVGTIVDAYSKFEELETARKVAAAAKTTGGNR